MGASSSLHTGLEYALGFPDPCLQLLGNWEFVLEVGISFRKISPGLPNF